jgi:hypothetical protein
MEEVPKEKKMQQAVEKAADERSGMMSREEIAARIHEGSKVGNQISSDMDEAARVAEEALKRLNGEA